MALLGSVFQYAPLDTVVPICISCNNKRISNESRQIPDPYGSQISDLRAVPPCDILPAENAYHSILGNMDPRTSRCTKCRAVSHDGARYCSHCAVKKNCCHYCGSRWRPLIYRGGTVLPPGAAVPNGWGNWFKSILFCTWPLDEFPMRRAEVFIPKKKPADPSWFARFLGIESVLDKLGQINSRITCLESQSFSVSRRLANMESSTAESV